MEKVAILGGAFNPIHYGHLRPAEEVREALGFSKVLFIPVSLPPHKDEILAGAGERLEMTWLATAGNPCFEVSDIEISRGGRSYTIDTVKELGRKGVVPAIITGCDAFNDITAWCGYEELFTLADFVVLPRPGYAVKKIGEVVPVELARKFWYDEKSRAYLNSFGRRVTYVETTLMDISSSGIRGKIKEGASVRYLLPEGVLGFILKKGLYR
ncbi:MAG: nicotinate (nicotinamide) nucleotide adenylyltransferase [Deltaproteobacteria bacterium]|nr:nicotinate (nicotinamide) nucleotide adenylyltransferase [Deltaproteobacteria bacterium]